jgi:heme exporter protein D
MGAMAFWDCVRQAWTEATRFVRRKPLTVAGAFAILLACNAISFALSSQYGPALPRIESKLFQWFAMSVRLAVMIALPIQVIRYVILGEHESRPRSVFGKEFWRYLGVYLAIGFGSMAIGALVVGVGFSLTHSFKNFLGATGLQLFVWITIAVCIVVFIAIRFSLLFCHVGIGRTIRWRASWSDTRGHFWRIFVSHMLALAPLEVFLIGLFALLRAWPGTGGRSVYPAAIVASLFSSLGMIVGATCACWLYRRLARALLENP